jgi:hypothetical protein
MCNKTKLNQPRGVKHRLSNDKENFDFDLNINCHSHFKFTFDF